LGMPVMAMASVPLVPRVDTLTASHDACLAPVRCSREPIELGFDQANKSRKKKYPQIYGLRDHRK
jgi:hypothetical protein